MHINNIWTIKTYPHINRCPAFHRGGGIFDATFCVPLIFGNLSEKVEQPRRTAAACSNSNVMNQFSTWLVLSFSTQHGRTI